MPGVLYIAQPQSGGPLKIGQTSGSALSRVRRLAGQSLLKYQLVRVFETDSPLAAEAIAFDWLANQGYPRVGGPRDEHVAVSLAVAIQACEAGVDGAKKVPDYAGRQPSTPASEDKPEWAWPKGPVWDALYTYPLTSGGRRSTLGVLASRAVKDASAQNRLRRLGLELVCFRGQEAEFRVEWTDAAALKSWVEASLSRPCATLPTSLTLRASRAAG